MKLEVKLFARARDVAGSETISVELPDESRVADLRSEIARQYPAMSSLATSLLVAVGTDYADETTVLSPEADVACFPPVSGG